MRRKIMLPLADGYRVIVPDMRGAGDSEKLVGPYDAWTLAQDIRTLLGEPGVQEPAFIVGHDMGGPVALAFAARYPEASRGRWASTASLPLTPGSWHERRQRRRQTWCGPGRWVSRRSLGHSLPRPRPSTRVIWAP
jgi:pimeloyl-ACP methyl ester carboxylesterase